MSAEFLFVIQTNNRWDWTKCHQPKTVDCTVWVIETNLECHGEKDIGKEKCAANTHKYSPHTRHALYNEIR